MTGDQIANLLYLVLLGSVIGGYFFVSNRANLGRTLQQALIWGLIFVGAVAVAGLWPQISSLTTGRHLVSEDGGAVEIPRSVDGHFYVTLEIEDRPVRFVVDTGATDMVLSREDAERIGIDTDSLAYLGRARTANGVVPIAQVVLDEVRLGPLTDRGVRASVNGGEMSGSLLGMGYLERFSQLEIAGDRLVLTR
jgi:aspartyl protease family protein